MSPTSPHNPTISLERNHHAKSLPNIKQDIPSDDLIETLYQFHQQQKDQDQSLSDENDENEEARLLQKQLNSDDIIVPVSSNTQPNLQFPPSYNQYVDNDTSTINFMNSKLQQKLGSRNSMSTISNQSSELYPLLPFDGNFITTIPESFSTSTISSFESVPPTLSHSITNSFSTTSLQLSPTQQSSSTTTTATLQMTPLRLQRKPSFSSNVASSTQTPLQAHSTNLYQTPLRKTPSITPRRKSHQRTRSRLSVDANGSAAVVSVNGSSATTLKSPNSNGGVNPFYTPSSSFVSPKVNHLDSPQNVIRTPFATPLHPASVNGTQEDRLGVSPYLLWKKDQPAQQTGQVFIKHKRFKSSDTTNDFGKAADLTLQLADKLLGNINGHGDDLSRLDSGLFPGGGDLTRSQSSINLSTQLEPAPESIQLNSHRQLHQQQQQPVLSHHQSAPSLPQNLYQQFDKLNFIPEIQNQPYAPLVQFAPSDTPTPKVITTDADDANQQHLADNLEIIVEKKDKKQKIHQCPLCGGRFQRPEHVKRHMRSHSSEKPFECGICNKRFNRNDNMKAHERKIHGLERNKKGSEDHLNIN